MLWLCCFVAADLAKDWKRKTNAISVQLKMSFLGAWVTPTSFFCYGCKDNVNVSVGGFCYAQICANHTTWYNWAFGLKDLSSPSRFSLLSVSFGLTQLKMLVAYGRIVMPSIRDENLQASDQQ